MQNGKKNLKNEEKNKVWKIVIQKIEKIAKIKKDKKEYLGKPINVLIILYPNPKSESSNPWFNIPSSQIIDSTWCECIPKFAMCMSVPESVNFQILKSEDNLRNEDNLKNKDVMKKDNNPKRKYQHEN